MQLSLCRLGLVRIPPTCLRRFASRVRPNGVRPNNVRPPPAAARPAPAPQDVPPTGPEVEQRAAGRQRQPVDRKPLPASVERMFRRPAVYVEPPPAAVARPWLPPESFHGQRTLNVAIVGEPNVGKSTLVNRLLRRKVSAVSSKYNTTRSRVLGVLTEGPVQIVFWDTPGFVPEGGSERHEYVAPLVTAAREAAEDADVVLFVVDVARAWSRESAASLRRMVDLCAQSGAHLFVLANKADLLREEEGYGRRGAAGGAASPSLESLLASRRAATVRFGSQAGGGTASGDSAAVPSGVATAAGEAGGLISGLWRLPPPLEPERGPPSDVPSPPADAPDLGSLLPEDGNYGCCWHPAEAEGEAAAPGTDAASVASSDAVVGETAAAAPPAATDQAAAAPAQPPAPLPPPPPAALLLPALDRRLLRLMEDFESAAFAAGLVGPGGFDDEGGARQAAFVYRLLPPVLPLSALRDRDAGGGVDRVRAVLQRLAPARPWEFNSRVYSDASPLDEVTEAVRERLLHHLHKEVPYRIRQENRSWEERADGDVIIHQDLQVPSRSIAGMLLVRQGGPIKAITAEAIRALEQLWSRKVHLYLHVTVKEGLKRGGGG